jgi:hypothetical protein
MPGSSTLLQELEYRGMIMYRPAARELSIDLMVGLFTASEGCGSVNGAVGTIMFRQAPLPSIAASHAARGVHRRIRTVLADHGGDGDEFPPAL